MRSSTRTCSETHQNELIPLLLSVFSVILLIDTIDASNNVRYAAKPYKARQTHVRTRFSIGIGPPPRGSFLLRDDRLGAPLPHPFLSLHISPPSPPLPYSPRPVGGPTKTNRPSSPTKAEQQHDRHVSKSGVRGEAKKHGAGSKGTWGSVDDDIKEAIKEAIKVEDDIKEAIRGAKDDDM